MHRIPSFEPVSKVTKYNILVAAGFSLRKLRTLQPKADPRQPSDFLSDGVGWHLRRKSLPAGRQGYGYHFGNSLSRRDDMEIELFMLGIEAKLTKIDIIYPEIRKNVDFLPKFILLATFGSLLPIIYI